MACNANIAFSGIKTSFVCSSHEDIECGVATHIQRTHDAVGILRFFQGLADDLIIAGVEIHLSERSLRITKEFFIFYLEALVVIVFENVLIESHFTYLCFHEFLNLYRYIMRVD